MSATTPTADLLGDDEATGLHAVLWDLDGTLVDSEPSWIRAEYELVAEYGGTWSDEHAHAVVGSALLDTAAYMREYGGVPLEPPAIVERLLESVIASLGRELIWRPGARELLLELSGSGVPCGLVTMTYRRMAEVVIAQLPPGTFSVVIAGDSVTHGKPHPEPYLLGAAGLGVHPSRCVALEDSPTGVRSAEAAGCITVAIPHVAHVPDAPGRRLLSTLEAVTAADLHAFATAST